MYAHAVGGTRYHFPDLRTLLARASPARSGDALAGLSAESAEERVAAQMALADLPLTLAELLPRAYADTPVSLYPLAERALLSHLLKLEREGRARQSHRGWWRVDA